MCVSLNVLKCDECLHDLPLVINDTDLLNNLVTSDFFHISFFFRTRCLSVFFFRSLYVSIREKMSVHYCG